MREIQSEQGEVEFTIILTANKLIYDQMKHLYNNNFIALNLTVGIPQPLKSLGTPNPENKFTK